MTQVAGSSLTSQELKVVSSVFIDNSIYPITLNITNLDLTFTEITTFNFIPISCNWFIVKGSDAYSAYNLYADPLASKDITFSLVLNTRYAYCSSVTYYNKLVKNVGYAISPQPSSMPNINITFAADNKTINIIIPAAE